MGQQLDDIFLRGMALRFGAPMVFEPSADPITNAWDGIRRLSWLSQ
ncbi:hypothetical protein J2T11_000067 [Paenarthrobacter nicotinovorans]|nr:hypothetical protein [Paenarthrobacter nicotinovorans]